MTDYTIVNLREDVPDMAPDFGYAPNMEARFASETLGMTRAGMSLQRLAPGFRVPFGHTHGEQEEVYVVLSGTLRAKVENDVVELYPFDAMRVGPNITRQFEAGPEGAELLAFGAPRAGSSSADLEMLPGWWAD